jgi:hypothetical protein
MTSDILNPSGSSRLEAKKRLRDALATHGGDPNHEIVEAAIAHLATLNPTPAPTQQTDLLDGNWLLISAPIFPDGERQADGTYVYSLGRLAFNMFQPQDLKLVINRVYQPVFPIDGSAQRTHDIVVEFTTRSEDVPPLPGIVRNLGVCQPSSNTTLQVQFTGGVLEPAPGTDLHQWQQMFGNPAAPASRSLKEWLQGLFLKLIFGLVPPTQMDAETGRIEFQMKRSPKGALDILYLDEELRITKGQKETVLVCDRVAESPMKSP